MEGGEEKGRGHEGWGQVGCGVERGNRAKEGSGVSGSGKARSGVQAKRSGA